MVNRAPTYAYKLIINNLKTLFWKCGSTYTAGSTQAPFSGTKRNP